MVAMSRADAKVQTVSGQIGGGAKQMPGETGTHYEPTTQRYRFRWRANGYSNHTLIRATSYAEACWKLGMFQAGQFTFKAHGVAFPVDFEMDLSTPEEVVEC